MTDEPSYWQKRWMDEHDRRLTEGAVLRAEALTILQTSQQAALDLARDAQRYRDEQANKLREQINSERGVYATKADLINSEEKLEALIAPALVAMQQATGSQITKGQLFAAVGVILAVLTLVVAVANGRF